MGGGASAMQGVDELLSTTYLIGRAISAITFPGMYRIYDFHSDKAPRLKNQRQFTFFAPDSDDEDDFLDKTPDESEYIHLCSVLVGEDRIYLEDPVMINDAGWTPLHTCCMSFVSVSAGLLLIDETIQRGCSLDVKTIAGPGTFNSGWTALHMACAYGIGELVDKLLQEGANVNTTNSFGYTPMLEACHRGFQNIVELLVQGGADLLYIPSDEESYSSPFVSAPAQSALAEASRCGFMRIVQTLLDAGAPKDQRNSLGWTALHEACFYNRIEVVKMLMLSGANASLRTRGGALPYHLAGLQIVRVMLQDMGGEEVVPEAGDTIDMVAILRELTMSDVFYENNRVCVVDDRPSHEKSPKLEILSDVMSAADSIIKSPKSYTQLEEERKVKNEHRSHTGRDEKSSSHKTVSLIHTGGILGDLPSLQNGRSPKNIGVNEGISNDISRALDYGNQGSEFPGVQGGGMSSPTGSKNFNLDSRADGKDTNNRYSNKTVSSTGKLKSKKKDHITLPPGFPPSYLCQLSQRPMNDPVKSIYGNVFDRPVILRWMGMQGHICPLSGAPLSESDLKPMEELAQDIKDWNVEYQSQLRLQSQSQIPLGVTDENNRQAQAQHTSFDTKSTGRRLDSAAEDLYDF